jgi:hypothetical protein
LNGATTVADKFDLATDYFSEIIGTASSRHCLLQLEGVDLPSLSPTKARALEDPFSGEEIRKVVRDTPIDRTRVLAVS